MPFLPNNPNALNAAAEDADQTELDSVHLDIVLAAARGDGVLSGCAVTAQVTPDMTVAVASGTSQIDRAAVTVTSGNLTIGANPESWQRYDLIVVNSSGVKSVVSGAAYANASNQVFPPIPASSVALAAVRVLPAAASITAGKVTDLRAVVKAQDYGAVGVLYVAASDAPAAERALADYRCDGTADNVEIQAALTAASAAGAGTVLLSTGTFNLAAELNLLGANDVDVESWVELVGQGTTRTRLVVASGLTGGIKLAEVWKGRLAKFTVEVATGSATHGIRSVATNTAPAGYRSFWGSTFEDIQVIGPWDNTHTGWAWHLESPFRSTFRNLEIGGVGNGVRLFSSNDAFNPGDCTFNRVFADIVGNTKTAFSIESTAAAGNMNQVVFTMVEAIATGSGCTGIYLGGSGGTPGPVNHTEWFGVNLEQFDTLVNIDRGQGNTLSLNYVETFSAVATAFKFGANAFNNRIDRAGMVFTSGACALVNDGNTALPSQPNIVQAVKVYANTGATVSVTLNAAKTTVLRDIVGDGPGTISAGVLTVTHRSGAGVPEGAVTAPVGSTFARTDGGADTAFYVKGTGAGNTGWAATATTAYVDTADTAIAGFYDGYTSFRLSAVTPNSSGAAAANSALIAAEYAALDAAGGGLLVLPAGTIWHTGIEQGRYCSTRGQGMGSTILKLANGSNTHNFSTWHYDALSAANEGTPADIPHGFTLSDLSIDGNKANQTSGHGIRLWGNSWLVDNVTVSNAEQDGIHCDMAGHEISGGVGGELEANLRLAWVYNCGGRGVYYGGPGDSHIGTLYVADCTGNGVEIDTVVDAGFIHSWGNDVGVEVLTNAVLRAGTLEVENNKSEGLIAAGSEFVAAILRAFNNWTVSPGGSDASIILGGTAPSVGAGTIESPNADGVKVTGSAATLANLFVSGSGAHIGVDLVGQSIKAFNLEVYGYSATGGIGIRYGSGGAQTGMQLRSSRVVGCDTGLSAADIGFGNDVQCRVYTTSGGQTPWAGISWYGGAINYDLQASGSHSTTLYVANAQLRFGADNTHDIGDLNDWRPRHLNLAGYVEMTEMTAPAAPGANRTRLFTQDNGSGKTQICAQFPTGAVQIVAQEP